MADYSSIVDGPGDEISGFLDRCMPAYDTEPGEAQLLDISRQIWDADNYTTWVVGFPENLSDCFFNLPVKAGNQSVLQTFSGDITIPQFSWLTKITFYSSIVTQVNPDAPKVFTGVREPFKLRVYDKGGKVDMIQKQFAWMSNVASAMQVTPTGAFKAASDPFGPYYLLEPKVLMPPGVIHVEITDMSGHFAFIQVALHWAVPRT